MNKLAEKILKEVYLKSSQLFGSLLHDVYLYGSYARGDYEIGSDIDILLTVDLDYLEIEKYTEKVAHISSELSLENDIYVSIAIKPLNLFVKYSNLLPYYKNVLNEGIRYAAT